MAKVSVLVPVYNVAPYLHECMDSILCQTLDDIEVLCGDGGSTDGSLDILREYERRDARVHVISKKSSGYGQSMNECLRMAIGEYIGIVESDDLISPTMYQSLLRAAHRFNADVVLGDFYLYWKDRKKIVGILQHDREYGKLIAPCERHDIFKAVIATWSGIYRRDFLLRNHIWYSETPGGAFQDVGFWCKALCFAQSVTAVHRPFYKWRQDNPKSSVKQTSKIAENTYREFALLRQFFESAAPDFLTEYADGLTWRMAASYMWVMEQLEGEAAVDHLLHTAEDFYQLREKSLYSDRLFSEQEREFVEHADMCFRKAPEEVERLQLQWKLEEEGNTLNCLKSSKEYRFGRAVFAVPNVVKKTIDRAKDRGVYNLIYSLKNKANL